MPCSRTQHGLTRMGLEPPTSGSGVKGINHQATARPFSFRRQLVKYTPTTLSNTSSFFVEKIVRICKRFSMFSNKKKPQQFCNIYVLNFNELLTTDVVNFEQLSPDFNFLDSVTYITRVGDRVVKLKQNYQGKSSVITFLRPGTPDQREMGIVVH